MLKLLSVDGVELTTFRYGTIIIDFLPTVINNTHGENENSNVILRVLSWYLHLY